MTLYIGENPVGSRGPDSHKNLVMGSYGSDHMKISADCSCKHEPFSVHINVCQNLHQERLYKPMKRSKSAGCWGFAKDPRAYSARS